MIEITKIYLLFFSLQILFLYGNYFLNGIEKQVNEYYAFTISIGTDRFGSIRTRFGPYSVQLAHYPLFDKGVNGWIRHLIRTSDP